MITIKRGYTGVYFLVLPINWLTRRLYRHRIGNYARIGTMPIYRIDLWRVRP